MVLYHATCQDCDEFDAEFELHGQRDLMADQHEHEFGHEVEREPESPEYEIVTDGGTSNVGIDKDDRCSECGELPELVEENATNPLTGDSWDRYKCDCEHTTVRLPA